MTVSRSDSYRDSGSVSLLLAVLFAGAVLLAGLLVDTGRVLYANADASDLAGKAARVGAQQIAPTSLRAGAPVLDPAAATTATRAYLDRHGVGGVVSVAADTVTVTVRTHITYVLLAVSGRNGATVVQTRSAVALSGP
ncbi:putative membrane protein [Frankia canadensis]|uniref:Putative membrane protein n=1 Tax=Frankia canadensis TaxID=1836972 RepID=A0A2I2L1A8_9ACTN|nr:pilus assembly protein TadG-related protein [Frankia canadensis]SNQ51695.1 putative membrane protein [Frankia canadensis]SOU58985.1 putative membrane protein [Frankia canadensis]